MKKIDQISHLHWKWKGIPTKLVDLHPKQLNIIKQTLNKSNNNWFGLSKDYWINAIKEVEIARNTAYKIMDQLKIKI